MFDELPKEIGHLPSVALVYDDRERYRYYWGGSKGDNFFSLLF